MGYLAALFYVSGWASVVMLAVEDEDVDLFDWSSAVISLFWPIIILVALASTTVDYLRVWRRRAAQRVGCHEGADISSEIKPVWMLWVFGCYVVLALFILAYTYFTKPF